VSILILARVGLGVLFGLLLGSLLGAFGTPWGALGSLWATLGSLGVTREPLWPAMGCSGMSLGLHFARLGRLFNTLGLEF
jgi:hypothetical protein